MKLLLRAAALLVCFALCVGTCACGASGLLADDAGKPPVQTPALDETAGEKEYAALQLKPEPFDAGAFHARLAAAGELLEQPEKETEVIAEYYALTEQLLACMTSYTLYDIACYADVTDDSLQEKSAEAYEKAVDCSDAYSVFLRDMLRSGYREAYIAEVGEENALMYEDYEPMTGEQKELYDREKALQDEYRVLMSEKYGSYAETAAAVAPLYVELVKLRTQIAQSYGYEDYVTYAYESSYYRSYTPAQAAELGEQVKKELAPLYVQTMLAETEDDRRAYYKESDTRQQTLLGLLQRYIPLVDSSLGASLDHMLAGGTYDIAYSETKHAVSFTTMLYSYGTPYLFSQPEKESQPISFGTLVHEFGHYHSFLNDPTYATPDGYIYALDDIDVAEISSTALELLFLEFYPELYGGDAQALRRGSITSILSNVVYGCMLDEFQQKVYTAEDLTAQEVSRICHGVVTDYMGDVFIDDYSHYMWAVVNHNFEAPLYYISYAMSALASFQIWADAQTDWDAAVEQYLELVSYGTNVDFIALLEHCGMQDVFSEKYLTHLADTLRPVLAKAA